MRAQDTFLDAGGKGPDSVLQRGTFAVTAANLAMTAESVLQLGHARSRFSSKEGQAKKSIGSTLLSREIHRINVAQQGNPSDQNSSARTATEDFFG